MGDAPPLLDLDGMRGMRTLFLILLCSGKCLMLRRHLPGITCLCGSWRLHHPKQGAKCSWLLFPSHLMSLAALRQLEASIDEQDDAFTLPWARRPKCGRGGAGDGARWLVPEWRFPVASERSGFGAVLE